MSKKNTIITLIILFVFFLVVITIAFIRTKNNVKGYIVASTVGAFYCENLNCKSTDFAKINNQNKEQFNVYYQNQLRGTYSMQYTSTWNFFNQNQEWINMPTDFIAFSPSLNITLPKYNTRDYTALENEELTTYIKSQNFDHEYHNVNKTAYEVDLNNDNQLDTIYIASNNLENTQDQYFFTTVYTKINNHLAPVEFITSTASDSMPAFHLYNIFKLEKNNKIGIIINKNYFSLISTPSMSLYTIKKDELNLIATSINEKNVT